MRRGEQPDAQTCRAINAFEHCARRTFAVRASDVDKAKYFLGIVRERGELECVFQSKLRAEQAQAVKKLDGFLVSHRIREQIRQEFFPPIAVLLHPDGCFATAYFQQYAEALLAGQFSADAKQNPLQQETPAFPSACHSLASVADTFSYNSIVPYLINNWRIFS